MKGGTVPAAFRAPDPPRGFRGSFFLDLPRRESAAAVAGPISLVPCAVAVPADSEDVASLVSWARREGIPLVPRGAGTGMPGGNVGAGVLVDLSRLERLEILGGGEAGAEAGPGTTAERIERAALASGRSFPPLPSSAHRCTLGGMVAANAAGARTFRHGATRRWVEALDVVLGDGTAVRLERGRSEPRFAALRDELARLPGMASLAWPKVRKNSSGYALDAFLPHGDPVELLVGSEGTLGIVTGVRIRLAPRALERAVALVPVAELDLLDALASECRRLGASACEFFGRRFLDISGVREAPGTSELVGAATAVALVEFEGTPDVVDEGLATLGSWARRLGARMTVGRTRAEMDALWEIRHAASPIVAAKADQGLVAMQFIEDSVVPDGLLTRYLLRLEDILREEDTDAVVFGHAGDGNVHVNPLVNVARAGWKDRVRRILHRTADLVASLGGTLSGEHGDGRIRGPFHERIFGTDAAAAFRWVKSSLDPAGILNPGVIVSGEDHDPLLGLTARRRAG